MYSMKNTTVLIANENYYTQQKSSTGKRSNFKSTFKKSLYN